MKHQLYAKPLFLRLSAGCVCWLAATLVPLPLFAETVSAYADGIPASWREQYFGADYQTNAQALATADPDGDGASNYQEYLAGTDPLNGASVKKVPVWVSTYAGSVAGGQAGFRTEATFTSPATVTVDAGGRIWICEVTITGVATPIPGAHRIRVLGTDGAVTTVAGGTEAGAVDGPLATASFGGPTALEFDHAGNAFVLERSNSRIRKINTEGVVSTFAGSTAGFQDGVGTAAQFNMPIGMCIDAADNLYVADFGNARVRKVTPGGEVSTYAGGTPGSLDGDRSVAQFETPNDMAIGPDGTLYVADWGAATIRTISPAGVVGTFASGLGYVERVMVDAQGNVYTAFGALGSFRKYRPDGTVDWTIGDAAGFQDGPIAAAKFAHFGKSVVRSDGSILVADGGNNRLRLLTLEVPPLLTISPINTLFTNAVTVSLGTVVSDGVVRYTLDGTEPTPASAAYAGSFQLTTAAVVKAAVFVNDNPVSGVLTQAYYRVYPVNDGIAADWRGQHFGADYQTNALALATADPDGDGASNYQEYLAGTNPLNAASVKRVPVWVSTYAGSVAGWQDGYRTEALFNYPGAGWGVDGAGNFLLTSGDHRIRKLSLDGYVTTVAGTGVAGSQDGQGTAASFNLPNQVVLDGAGNAYINEVGGHRIRKMDAEGNVTVFAGSTQGYLDGTGTAARFNTPQSIALGPDGNLYVADTGNQRIRKITPEGVVTTYAGSTAGYQEGDRAVAKFSTPAWLDVDGAGAVYVADWGNARVRKIDSNGGVSTVASGLSFVEVIHLDGRGGFYVKNGLTGRIMRFDASGQVDWVVDHPAGFQDGPIDQARFSAHIGGFMHLSPGELLVSDYSNHRLRLITLEIPPLVTIAPTNTLFTNSVTVTLNTTVTGGVLRYTLDGANPTPASPTYGGSFPLTVAATVKAAVFVNDNPVSGVLTQAYARVYALNDGIPASWREQYFGADYQTNALALATADPDGDGASNYQEYLAGTDPLNGVSVKRVPVWVSTYAGSVAGGQDGFRSEATFNGPNDLTFDAAGNLWIPESGGQRIRRLSPDGVVTTVAGDGVAGDVDGAGLQARFNGPCTVALDDLGNAYASEVYGNRVRKLDAAGNVTTLAGSTAGFADGTGAAARFNSPRNLTLGPDGSFYLIDLGNHRIRKITPEGVVTTYAGSVSGFQDGDRSVAKFNTPSWVDMDSAGVAYVADWGNARVRKIAADGVVSTVATGQGYIELLRLDGRGGCYVFCGGTPSRIKHFDAAWQLDWQLEFVPGLQDGPAAQARFSPHNSGFRRLSPTELLVADVGNHRVRLITLGVPPLLTISPAGTLFTNSVTVSLSTVVSDGVVRYTLDGTEPTPASPVHDGSFQLTAAATVKAAVFVNDNPVSGVLTQAYARVYALDDGIAASWREQYFGAGYLTDPRVAADADPDGDGATNLQEYMAGTDPLDAASHGPAPVGNWLQRATATGMSSRVVATGVWTGREFIVWGGEGPGIAYRTGGRFSPSSNQWSYVDSGTVLSARSKHSAVWTGSEMIVWGGATGGSYFNDGARYSPDANAWTPVAPNPSLAGRYDHVAVWTGTEMIVWGGYGSTGYFSDGGAYNPATDHWRALPTEGVPAARSTAVAVWTGREMIVWGGGVLASGFDTGARYDPVENRWRPMSTSGAPEGRYWTTAVWTGTEMIVWGGRGLSGTSLSTAGRYNPQTDTWQPVSLVNAPTARDRHVAVWTGTKMIIWGGASTPGGAYQQNGGVYDPATDSWTALITANSPFAFAHSTAVWTGRSMLVFGGFNGGYDRNMFSCVIDPLNDGIPDSWRQQYFGADFAHDPRVVAAADPDGDGANNSQEYMAGSNPLDADSPGRAPLVSQPPVGQTVPAGTPLTLSVTVSGTAPLSYQWWKDGSPIEGATTDRLEFPNIQTGDAGIYKVGVTNSLGGVESEPVQLAVHYSLTVTSGAGGTVTRLPAGASQPPGTGVQLTAVPAEGFAFASWSGDASGSEPSITVLMNGHKTVHASFRETVAPVVQIQSPASGDSLQRVVNLVGTASDNVGVTSVRWYRDGELMGTIATGAGEFRQDGIQLDRGPNTFRVVASDAAGNEGSAEVVVNWNPARVLAFVPSGPVREGRQTYADLVLTTDAVVGGMTFVVHYDVDYLREPRFDWSAPLASALTQVNTAVPGEVRATFALGGNSLAVGQHTLGRLFFRVRSVPNDLETVLSADILDISGSTGTPLPGLNDTQASPLSLLRRTLVGDNNGNRRLDIGDAAVMQRLLAGIEPLRSWDGLANDLNESGALDSGDVVKLLRLLARMDGDDPRLSEPPGQTGKSAARVAVSAKVADGGPVESGTLTPAHQAVQPGGQVTVEVRLEDLQTPILGASFALDYPTNALRLLSSESLQVGALVPAGALATWNVAPQPSDYSAQTGCVYLATVSEAPWTGAAGVLARFTFEVQPNVTAQHLWPVTVSGIEVAADGGFENRVLPGGIAFVVGRDPLPPIIKPEEKPKVTEHTFSAGFTAELHAVYVIEYSDDLRTWNVLATVTNTTGTVNINDPSIAARPRCYYRLRQVQ